MRSSLSNCGDASLYHRPKTRDYHTESARFGLCEVDLEGENELDEASEEGNEDEASGSEGDPLYELQALLNPSEAGVDVFGTHIGTIAPENRRTPGILSRGFYLG